ncbi:MAG: hypothetical protein ACI9ON_002790 [Limisphaerales bacterium]|jgi:hypothetical protein
MHKIIFILAALLCSHAVQAQDQPKPAFMQPEVLRAALAINMTEAQKPQFQAALTRFFDGRWSSLARLMQKNNQTDLPRKWKKKTNSLLKTMDKEVAGFLTEEQLPAYDTYRNTLKSNLKGM